MRGKVAELGAKGSIVMEESKGLAGGGGEPCPLMAFSNCGLYQSMKRRCGKESPPLPIK